MHRFLVVLTLLAAAGLAPAAAEAGPLRLGAGYFGDFMSHPGGYVALSTEAASAGRFSVLLGGDLGGYHHERNHTGLFLRAHLATRVRTAGGFFVEPRFVAGYLHSIVDGDEFWLVDDQTGDIRIATPGGSPNLTYGLGLGLGYELRRGPASGLSFVVRPEILGRAPYNDFTLSQFSLLAGLEWRIGG